MVKKLAIGASALALLATPALALQDAPKDGHGQRGPQTRAELQTRIQARFAKMDVNKDGAVTQEEIKAAREARMKERADKRFAALDADKSGQISRAEFDAGHAKMREGFAERRKERADAGKADAHRGHGMRGHHWRGRMHGKMGGFGGGEGWFAKADANKDGKLTLAEMQAGPLQWFDNVDTNKDGTISPEERKAAFEKMRQARAERRAQTPAPAQQN